ncbi:taste receptor type 2 member 40-like [Lissotriton helveticus]
MTKEFQFVNRCHKDIDYQALESSKLHNMLPFWIFFLVFHCIALLIGIANNTFMASVIIIQCARSRQLPTSCDLLLLALALVNIPLQCCVSGDYLVRFLWHEVYYRLGVWKIFFVLIPIVALSSFWINSWLCVFYCGTIVNLSHPLFVNLKRRITTMVPWFILSSTLASLAIGISVIWSLGTPPPSNSSATNTTSAEAVTEYSIFHKILMCVMGCFVPVVVMFISAVLVLRSLYRHTRQMQQNNTGFTSGPSMAAHKRAAKTLLSL